MTAREIIDAGLFEQAVNLMDDEIREQIHAEFVTDSDYEFLVAYMEAHFDKYGERFTV